jgi:cell division protease FtsH
VVVSTPDLRGRERILQVHTRRTPLAQDVDIAILAKGTPGFSGADLENLVNEAALQAAKLNKDRLNMSDFEYAKDKVLMGKERRSLVLSDEEKKITAYHEAGHALTAKLLPGSDPVHKVSIIPRGRALGVTMQLPEEDRHGYSRNYLRNNLVILLGGRVAEEIIFTDITTGAGNDIERVTKTARKMVCEWGMSEKIGPQTVGDTQQEVFLGREWGHTGGNVSTDMARLVDSEIKALVDEARERCRTMLTENIDALHAIANALLERETISGDEIDILMRGEQLPPFQTGTAADEFKLEPADDAENAEAAPAADSPAAPVEAVQEEAQAEQEAPAPADVPAETPAEPQKPANGSFSGRWDSFSAPSDSKDDK